MAEKMFFGYSRFKDFLLARQKELASQNPNKKYTGQMNSSAETQTKGEQILQIIDLYNIAHSNMIANLKNGSGSVRTPIEEVLDIAENKNSNVDIDWFVENLRRLRLWGTFDNIDSAKDAIKNFEELKIDLPEYVKNCCSEIETRTKYINKLIDEKKYQWSQDEINNYTNKLNKELVANTYDSDNEDKYIKENFDKIVKE